jgi:hypothetical protein
VNNSCDTNLCLSLFGDLQNTVTSIYKKTSSAGTPLPDGTFIFSVNVSSTDGRMSTANTNNFKLFQLKIWKMKFTILEDH